MIGAISVNIQSITPVILSLVKAMGLLANCIIRHRK